MTDTLASRLNIAVVRFSALGDVVMVAAAVDRLRQCLPHASITWITSPMAYSLLEGMEGVHFEVYDKPRSWADYRAFYRAFRHRRFDVVLAMQANLRINLLYPALKAERKIGFDRIRAREGQWLFCNRRIPFADEHLLDSFMAFTGQLGCGRRAPDWALPISEADRHWAQARLQTLPRPLIAIHPHASKAERNWPPERYAAIIARLRQERQAGIVLTGGPAEAERELCARLAAADPAAILDLCGQTTPKQLAAVLGQADALIAPDTGAVHLARAMGTPVIGLYAVAPSKLTGPHGRMEYCVDRYPQALKKYLGKDAAQIPWNTRVHHPDAMALIEVEDVLLQLERLMEQLV
ncbi:MAG: glycosyltransferase family 9 protein [Gallionella sp.]|nr:glycosyltransferase family 9 protein [Gallionella sp.]